MESDPRQGEPTRWVGLDHPGQRRGLGRCCCGEPGPCQLFPQEQPMEKTKAL